MLKITPLLLSVLLFTGLCGCGDDEPVTLQTQVDLQNINETIPENPANGQTVATLAATASSGSLLYTITSQTPAGALALNPDSGGLTIADASLFDYEARQTVTAQVSATADDASATGTVTINLENITEVLKPDTLRVTVNENPLKGSILGTINLETDATEGTLNFSVLDEPNNPAIAISATTGEVTVLDSARFDYELNPEISTEVSVFSGELSDTTLVIITVSNTTETVTAADFTATLDENTAEGTVAGTVSATTDAGTLTYSLEAGADSGAFAIDASTGEITIANTSLLDYETKTQLTATYRATSGMTSATASITVNLRDVIENIVASPFTTTTSENAPAGRILGTLQAQLDVHNQIMANKIKIPSDPVINFTLLSGQDANAFAVNRTTGQISVNNASLYDFEQSTVLTARYQASYGGLTSESTITVNLQNVTESIRANNLVLNLQENQPAGKVLGTVKADKDPVDAKKDNRTNGVLVPEMQYTLLTGENSSAFTLDQQTGELKVADAQAFDYEKNKTLTAEYQATYGKLSSTGRITVNLQNVAENVNAKEFSVSIQENPQSGTFLGTLAASTDTEAIRLVRNIVVLPTGPTLSFSIISGQNSSAFAVDASTGELTVADASLFDYEKNTVLTANFRATYGSLTSESTITVTITDDPAESTFITFTDAKFKAKLVSNTALNTNGDQEISYVEAQNYTGAIQVDNSGITNIDEVRFFPNITRLIAFRNNISSVDLSKNTQIFQLLLEQNQLSGNLDLSKNTMLRDVKLHTNQLTGINMANGNNASFSRFEAQRNANLNCIQVDSGFTPNSKWAVDNRNIFRSTGCF